MQTLKLPASCAQIQPEEQEMIYGGAPEWVETLKDELRPYWHQAKPYVLLGVEVVKAMAQCVSAAASIYVNCLIIRDSMKGIKASLLWFVQ